MVVLVLEYGIYSASRKGKMPLTEAFQPVKDWQELFSVVVATPDCLKLVMTLTGEHFWSFWDALIWAIAKQAGVTHLLSEDFQDGRILEGLTVINPFRLNPFEEGDQVV
jgi:predicted nucleic acid-binding protein